MVLVGRLKVSYRDLFLLSNNEIECLIDGHEIDIRERIEMDRLFTGLLLSPYTNKGYKIENDIIFPWEEKQISEFWVSKEDFNDAREILNKIKKVKNGR